MSELTPQAIVQELDKYIIGQPQAKRAVAIALRTRYRRMQLDEELRVEVTPKNIMMIGPTGVGKTEIARRLAKLANAPFLKVEVTKFTQVGYVGRDVDSIIRDLLDVAVTMVQDDKEKEVQTQAEQRAQERVLQYLYQPQTARELEAELNPGMVVEEVVPPTKKNKRTATMNGSSAVTSVANSVASTTPAPAPARQSTRVRAALKKRISEALFNKELEERMIEIELDSEDNLGNMLEYMTTISSDEGNELFIQPNFVAGRKRTRRVSVRDARRLLAREESQKLIDLDQVVEEATNRAEQNGIVFLDEIDKIVGSKVDTGPDVSGEGVQRDLLPIVEGSTVVTRYGPMKTDHILWIAAGAFHKHKPSDLIPELQGRFPLRVELESLSEQDFKAILTQPYHALTRQYQQLLRTESVDIEFTDDGLDAMARFARILNERQENIGARRLHTIMEKVMEEVSYNASTMQGEHVTIDGPFVEGRLQSIMANEDLSKYIL